MEQNPTAILRFKDGSSETVIGEAASRLQERLHAGHEMKEHPQKQDPPAATAPSPKSLDPIGLILNADDHSHFGESYPRRKKGWFYRKEKDGREHFLAFVNAKGSCSLRTFNAGNGIFRGKVYRAGDYQDNFAALIEGATELTVHNQPNLERDCNERLPENILAELRSQID
jgi:hypothetical protein